MKYLISLFILYALFLLEVTVGKFAPHLLLSFIIVTPFFYSRRWVILLGLIVGILFGFLNPKESGFPIIFYSTIAYGMSLARQFFLFVTPFAESLLLFLVLIISILFYYLLRLLLFANFLPISEMAVKFGLTVLILFPIQYLFLRLKSRFEF